MTDTITVVGNIASNPEHRTAGVVPVTSFRIATSERRPDAQGAWADAHTNYYTVSAFRTLADNAFTSLRKGDRVIVSGRLRVKEWTAADGSKGRSVEIDADALGHDLRFGTAVYQRGGRSETGTGESGTVETGTGAPGTGEGATSGEWISAVPGEAWAAPGVQSDSAGGTDADRTAGQPADAADASGPLELVGSTTPF